MALNRKTCPYCGGSSYSATTLGVWTCPYCHRDITRVKARPAAITGKVVPFPRGSTGFVKDK